MAERLPALTEEARHARYSTSSSSASEEDAAEPGAAAVPAAFEGALGDAVEFAAEDEPVAEFGEKFIRVPTLDASVVRERALAIVCECHMTVSTLHAQSWLATCTRMCYTHASHIF